MKRDLKICIIDYQLGNIKAFKNIYNKLNINAEIVSKTEQFEGATHLILPGVGSFDWAISKLNRSGLRDTLDQLVLKKKVPILGVCVGMQIMSSKSEEGQLSGLNWIDGNVKKFKNDYILPHMGWNQIKPFTESIIFKDIKNLEFYFLHSYYYKIKEDKHILSTTEYSNIFTSAINKNNIYGTQFHPEKSHQSGIKLLENFSKIKC